MTDEEKKITKKCFSENLFCSWKEKQSEKQWNQKTAGFKGNI